MEINKSFSFKLFFILFLVSLIPLILVFLYFLRVVGQATGWQLNTTFLIFLLLFFLTVALDVIGTILISRSIYDRLVKYNVIARQIAGGKFELRLPADSDDELGKLGRFFNMLTKEHHEIKKKGVGEKLFEREKIQAILKNIGDGVIVTDNFNKIELLNSVAENWFGKKQNEYAKHKINDLITDHQLLSLIEKVKEGKNSTDEKVEIQIKPFDGVKEIVLQAIATKVVNEHQQTLGVATTLRDLTKEKEINRKKTEVVSMVSHELRSPLTSIAGFSELLLDEGISREQAKDYADIILKESRRLNDLINKYLDITRIESGKSEFHKTVLNIEDVIRSVLGMHGFLAEKKKINVKLNVHDPISNVYVDRQMMGEVILNLFSNAVKYSRPQTTITIEVQETEKEQIIKVMDQGYGIPEKALTKIFEKFYRVTDNELVQEEIGSGLGLSLVQEIITQHGGKIWVESELNKGSAFYISLKKNELEEVVDTSMDNVIIA